MRLRGGKQLEGLKEVTNNEFSHDRNEHVKNVEKEISPPAEEVIDDIMHKPDEFLRILGTPLQIPTPHLYHFLEG